MMASRAARILLYPGSHFSSHHTSFTSRFHLHYYRAPHLSSSQFQVLAPRDFGRITHRQLSTGKSAGLSNSVEHIRSIFAKGLDVQRWFTEKIQALLLTNIRLGLATVFTGSVCNILYAQYSNWVRQKALYSALAMGAVPDVANKEELVHRTATCQAIESILKPESGYANYDMIVGNHGTGKTTLVCHVGHQLNGIVYVDISPNSTDNEAFAEQFAKALHWTPVPRFWLDRVLSYWDFGTEKIADNRALLVKVFKEFCTQAELFKKQNARSPVLVIDNVNRLAQKNPTLLDILQDMAKDAADKRLFITVFVSSEGKAPIQMMGKFGRSASSRLGKSLEIADLTRNEAIDFLCKKRGVNESLAQDIYTLVGGRIGLLVRAVNQIRSGMDFAGLQSIFLGEAEEVLLRGGIKEGAEFRPGGIRIAQRILRDGHISRDHFYQISGSVTEGDKLLSINIFATVPRCNWVVFDTKPIESAMHALVKNSADEK